jgi:hypothetical protein
VKKDHIKLNCTKIMRHEKTLGTPLRCISNRHLMLARPVQQLYSTAASANCPFKSRETHLEGRDEPNEHQRAPRRDAESQRAGWNPRHCVQRHQPHVEQRGHSCSSSSERYQTCVRGRIVCPSDLTSKRLCLGQRAGADKEIDTGSRQGWVEPVAIRARKAQ